ncbi:cell division protein FtsQ/DivIB [Thermocrinis minervae]|uniref:Cell division septal protein FtsQ n=1 Tax=Thermocrinis minervae TaxID=381751 RepID=A0A1M6Q3V2_9AQUI|nr:hypothetical protein [Thermocrinis minervae]SHK14902.1 Cell division septal protein FtsQ [Thermocrinis minervae]
MKAKRGKAGQYVDYMIIIFWISTMAMVGYFLPYLIGYLPFFKVRGINVLSTTYIPPSAISEIVVQRYKGNWLYMSSDGLKSAINSRFFNAVEELDIRRLITKEGAYLEIYLKERKPYFTVFYQDKVFYVDQKGNLFQNPYIPITYPYIYTYDVSIVKDYFKNINSLISVMGEGLKEIYLSDIQTVLYSEKGNKFILPPIWEIDQQIIGSLSRVYNMSMTGSTVDLTLKDMVILKEGLNSK